MDKSTKLFWSEPDMEQWPKLEQDPNKVALLQDLGHTGEGADEY